MVLSNGPIPTEATTKQLGVRQKKPYTRTKFGCRQCKIRKVRCDEEWPTCGNCAKNKRQCDRAPPTRSDAASFKFKTPLTISHFRPSTSLSGLTQEDIPYLDVFRHRLIDDIVGSRTRPAWRALLMQALHQEPAFRHAVVAFGAACGLVDGTEWPAARYSTGLPVPAPNKALALRNYNACLQGVQRLIARREGGHVDSTLACALMCICFELRIGMPHMALRHLEYSLDIIKANSADVTDDLSLAFAKLDIQSTMFIGKRPLKTDMAALFRISMGGAGKTAKTDRAITYLLGRIFYFLRANPGVFRGLVDRDMSLSVSQELVTLQRDLERFRISHSVVGVPNLADAKMLPQPHQALWITCLILEVILSSCFCNKNEMVYDAFLAHFESITTMAEDILSRASKYSDGYKDFRLDVALLYPLFMTAQLCRHPGIRRRILRLMGEVSFDEGVWDGSSGKSYIQLMMRLEEAGLEFEELDLDSLGPSVIPEHQRVRPLNIQPENAERYSTLFFRYNRESGRWNDLVETVVW